MERLTRSPAFNCAKMAWVAGLGLARVGVQLQQGGHRQRPEGERGAPRGPHRSPRRARAPPRAGARTARNEGRSHIATPLSQLKLPALKVRKALSPPFQLSR